MIKLMIHLVKIIVATFITILFSSCKYDMNLRNSITGSGNVVTRTRNVTDFDKITLSDGLDCEVIQGNTSVKVEADDNLQDGIKTSVENGILLISSKYNNYDDVKSKKVIVTLPIISNLTTESGSHLFTKNAIKSNEIYLKSSSGSKIDANVESEKINCDSSSGSAIEIEGKAIYLDTESSSGSTIDAKRLFANEANARSSSGSSTIINPILSLKAHASSGSSINYQRRPKTISVKESSGGSVQE
jgi:hypothetical protein